MAVFEPVVGVLGRWLCPCHDAVGQTAVLEELEHSTLDHKAPATIVRNFRCDQNGDVWQLVNGAWHYAGRPREAWEAT